MIVDWDRVGGWRLVKGSPKGTFRQPPARTQTRLRSKDNQAPQRLTSRRREDGLSARR